MFSVHEDAPDTNALPLYGLPPLRVLPSVQLSDQLTSEAQLPPPTVMLLVARARPRTAGTVSTDCKRRAAAPLPGAKLPGAHWFGAALPTGQK